MGRKDIRNDNDERFSILLHSIRKPNRYFVLINNKSLRLMTYGRELQKSQPALWIYSPELNEKLSLVQSALLVSVSLWVDGMSRSNKNRSIEPVENIWIQHNDGFSSTAFTNRHRIQHKFQTFHPNLSWTSQTSIQTQRYIVQGQERQSNFTAHLPS